MASAGWPVPARGGLAGAGFRLVWLASFAATRKCCHEWNTRVHPTQVRHHHATDLRRSLFRLPPNLASDAWLSLFFFLVVAESSVEETVWSLPLGLGLGASSVEETVRSLHTAPHLVRCMGTWLDSWWGWGAGLGSGGRLNINVPGWAKLWTTCRACNVEWKVGFDARCVSSVAAVPSARVFRRRFWDSFVFMRCSSRTAICDPRKGWVES